MTGSSTVGSSDLPEDMFMSDQGHFEFIGLSNLNAQLDTILRRKKGSTLIEITGAAQKGHHRGSYEHQQDVLADLLIRQHEVVAVILTSLDGVTDPAPQSSSTNPSSFTKVAKPQIIVAANPRKDDFEKQKKFPDTKLRVDALPRLKEHRLDRTDSVVGAVLRHYQSENGTVLFPRHVGWFMGLLKDCHDERQDDLSYNNAAQALRTYVYLVSHPKMLKRMKLGKDNDCNFWEVLTTSAEAYPADLFNDQDISRGLLQLRSSKEQAEFIAEFVARNSAEDPPELDSPEFYKNAERIASVPLYDVNGRRFFHNMMSDIVQAAFNALEALAKRMAQLVNKKDKNWKQIGTSDVNEVASLVQDAEAEINFLHRFLALFGQQDSGGYPGKSNHVTKPCLLIQHLEWLSAAAQVQGRTGQTIFRSGANPVPGPVTQGTQTTDSTAKDREDADRNASDPILEGSAANDEILDADQDSQDDDSEAEDELQQLADQLNESAIGPNTGWALSTLKYLHLGCLHERGLEHACPAQLEVSDRIKSEHIRNAEVTVVDIKASEWQTTQPSIATALDMVMAENSEDIESLNRDEIESRITKAKADAITAKHMENTLKRSTPLVGGAAHSAAKNEASEMTKKTQALLHSEFFNGTMHCETILFSAMVLLKEAPQLEQKLTDNEWLQRNGIFGLQSTLLNLVRHPLPLINVSKRCCPACWKVYELMVEHEIIAPLDATVAVPGYHTKWSAVRLPPFLPKQYVQKSIDHARTEVKSKLKKLQSLINEEKSNASGGETSPGSDPSASGQKRTISRKPQRNSKKKQSDWLSSSPSGMVGKQASKHELENEPQDEEEKRRTDRKEKFTGEAVQGDLEMQEGSEAKETGSSGVEGSSRIEGE